MKDPLGTVLTSVANAAADDAQRYQDLLRRARDVLAPFATAARIWDNPPGGPSCTVADFRRARAFLADIDAALPPEARP